MKKFYISSLDGHSGISKYSQDFYRLVLKEKGYIYMNSAFSTVHILSEISSQDHVHIEVGIFQKKEIQILFLMLKANYKNVVVTLHDAPLIKYPFYEFKNEFLNKLSKFYDKYANSLGVVNSYVKRIKSIYVLSKKGQEAVKRKYKINNVYFLPHIIDSSEIERDEKTDTNFIYFGFIGRNKGIEYSLQLHQKLLEQNSNIHFYVVGKPLGIENKFYETLRQKYTKNVHYFGYVPEEQLSDIFAKATFALILFKNYRFFWPLSGSILYSLKKGKILFTNKVNAVSEIIENGKNGFYLSGKANKDISVLQNIINNKSLLKNVRQETFEYLTHNHSPEIVIKKFKD